MIGSGSFSDCRTIRNHYINYCTFVIICDIRNKIQWNSIEKIACFHYKMLSQAQIKQNIKAPSHCAGNSPMTGELLVQMASNAVNVSIRWRQHDCFSNWGRRVSYMPLLDIRMKIPSYIYILFLAAPNHYWTQQRLIVKRIFRTTFQRNLIQNNKIRFSEMHLKMSCAKSPRPQYGKVVA